MALHHHRTILIFAGWGIGDLILLWPLLEALREQAPRAGVVVMVADPAGELLEDRRVVDELRSYQEFGIRHLGETSTAAAAALGAWLRERDFDAIADALTAPRAVRREVWRQRAAQYEKDRRAVATELGSGHGAGAALMAGAVAGWGLHPRAPRQPRADSFLPDESALPPLVHELGIEPGFVAMLPFASHPLKQWPAAAFARLADHLTREGRQVVLFEAPSDTAAMEVREQCRESPAPIILPPLHLRQAAAALAAAGVCVGNDTGLSHLAAAGGTPAVAVFGPSDGRVYTPGGRTELAAMAATPCRYRQSGTMAPPACWVAGECLIQERSCIEEVGVETVLRKLALAESRSREHQAVP